MEMSLWNLLVLSVAILGAVNAENVLESKPEKSDGVLEERVRTLETEIQRVKEHLSVLENLVDAWILNGEQLQPQPYLINGADANLLDVGSAAEKRAGWAFMGSRGKRKQPFIMGSRGKRSIADMEYLGDVEDDMKDEMEKRAGNYFYGSRGKKQYPTASQDGYRQQVPYTNKRYTFMGSRGKK